MKSLLAKLDAHAGELIEFTPSDTRVAAAVLLFRAILADGRVRDVEMKRYREILQDHMDVEPDELRLFEDAVRKQSDSETSLLPHTMLASKMPLKTKREILQFMKEISVSDNELHEFEINLVTRNAKMLGLPIDEGEF
ncbi:MAG: TerB family tellurite resistance protein [Rhizobiaceae bacterium]|nr:TerB family tellurite resistance protein [Rhizobiaceae bacterium]